MYTRLFVILLIHPFNTLVKSPILPNALLEVSQYPCVHW